MDLTGKTIKDRYFIVEKAASGGSGKLYLARDMELGCIWAVKEIPLARKQEARLLRQMQHPSLPRMVDYAELDESCFLIMEYVRGESLAQCLKKQKSLSYRRVLELAAETASALEYLHTRKPPICHADIKPENLMYTENGKIKLVDFGSSAFSSEMPRSRTEGTPGYAPPEQKEGYLTCQGDIYALGKTLETAAGRSGMFFHPDFALFIRACTRPERKDRTRDITSMSAAIQRLRMHQSLGPLILSGAAGAFCLLASLAVFAPKKPSEEDFRKELATVTARYCGILDLNPDQMKSRGERQTEMEEVCEKAETDLQALLTKYTGEEEQTRTLLLLAANSELKGDPRRAALYYEQVLLYHPGQEQAYPSYGLFLLRQGQIDQSRSLWDDFLKAIHMDGSAQPEYRDEADAAVLKSTVLNSHEGRLWKKRLKLLEMFGQSEENDNKKLQKEDEEDRVTKE